MDSLQSYLASPIALAVLVGLLVFYGVLRSKSSPLRSLPLPPGPPITSWLSGHLSILPTKQPWKVYAEWAKKYGSVIHLRVYGQHTIVLSSLDDCKELFEKRPNLYSDRPRLTMIDLMGWDFNAALMPYGPRWRGQRCLFQQSFKRVASLSYRPEQTRKVNDMLYGLLTSPQDLRDHTRTVTAAIALSVAYGYDIEAKKDYFVDLVEGAVSRISLAIFPGAALVNAIPILRHLPSWFPGASFHKLASETKDMTTKMQEVPLNWVRKNMEAGTQHSCLLSEQLPGCKSDKDVVALQEFTALVYAAGADTTTTALETFFLAMIMFPEAQKRAQDELDTVVGESRLPNYDDWESMPYTEALMREVLRWRPVAPLGVAHAITEDDVYQGYLIPKGSVIMVNIWALSRDKMQYKDPEDFNPDRLFDKDGNLNNDNSDYVFGHGRRLCPGRHMARATLWLSMATTLWAFNISKGRDNRGNEIPINVEYSDGLISHPDPHPCSLTPRSSQVGRIIEEAVSQTRGRSL